MRPLVGITQRLREAGGGRRARLQLDPAYAEALAEAGALPVHLPCPADPGALAARLDALVVPGGPDFPPGLLGERPYPPEVRFDAVAARQLDFDRAVLAAARERGLPVLGICYGMQLLALEAEGRLHPHLPVDRPGAACHKPEGPGDARHGLRVEPGTLLAAVLGAGESVVNSRHHQAVAEPGRWRVCARADDGVVEAVEPPDAGPERFALGVQWHPERMEAAHRRALFGALVDACRARAAGG